MADSSVRMIGLHAHDLATFKIETCSTAHPDFCAKLCRLSCKPGCCDAASPSTNLQLNVSLRVVQRHRVLVRAESPQQQRNDDARPVAPMAAMHDDRQVVVGREDPQRPRNRSL